MIWRFTEAIQAILIIACGIVASDLLATILRFIYGVIVALWVVVVLSGCSRTEYAKIDAYGLHAITPYGIISMGVLSYQRVADPKEEKDE